MNDIVHSNVHCTNCGRDFGAEFDIAMDGDLTIVCPHCAHEHYRVVEGGEVTERRWASSGGGFTVQYANTSRTTYVLTMDSAQTSTSTSFTNALWVNMSAGS